MGSFSGVDWSGYEPHEIGTFGAWQLLPGREARKRYERVISSRPERIVDLALRNGYLADDTDQGLLELGRLFIERFPTYPDGQSPEFAPERIDPRWLAALWDLSNFVGTRAISRHPQLSWTLVKGSKNKIDYQTPSLVGFPSSRVSRYGVFYMLEGMAGEIFRNGAPHLFELRGHVVEAPARRREKDFVLKMSAYIDEVAEDSSHPTR